METKSEGALWGPCSVVAHVAATREAKLGAEYGLVDPSGGGAVELLDLPCLVVIGERFTGQPFPAAAVLAVSLLRAVGKSPDRRKAEDISKNPWFALLQDLVEAIKARYGAG